MMMSLRWLGRCRRPVHNLVMGSLDSSLVQRKLIGVNGIAAQLLHTSFCHKFKENTPANALAIMDNIKQMRHSPTPALAFGLSGLIPIAAAPVFMITSGAFDPSMADTQLIYGAVVLSFLGGVRWGLTLSEGSSQPPDWHNLGYSVTPPLIAWLGILAPYSIGVITVIAGVGFAGYMDLAMMGYPNWFKGLRFCLTLGAVLSLWTCFVCKFILDELKEGEEVKSEPQ
ncbi:transmembrane protein 69 [Procambarus clarkii]|uniref:transmembrane protein 69 n=1 Tax=Procambarus clarkii TaxID=6728 RepID=UPI0037430F61